MNTQRLNKLRQSLADQQLDVTYISDFKTIQYLTGFGSDPIERTLAMVVFADADPFLFVPALEEQVVRQLGWPYDLYSYQDNQDSYAMIVDHIKERIANPRQFGVEAKQIPYYVIRRLASAFDQADFSTNITPIVEQQKLIKESDEIEKLIQAGKDADLAFEACFKALALGKSELQIAAELEYATKMRNIPQMSFPTLVQTGTHAADPHGETSDRQLENNAMVLFDLGTVYQGYISDATRTVALGTPSEKQKEVHQVVLEANLAAEDAAKPGITAAELDNVARQVIEKAGYGEYFIHRLGHGIGMSEHEFPSIMAGNDLVLAPNMAFSIEPGVYIPGELGVRIEDCVYLTEDGAQTLTHTDKSLLSF